MFPGWHVWSAAQQVPHDAASQRQVPIEQYCPDAQGSPVTVPHVHVPLDEQVSAVVPHALHIWAPVPHAPGSSVVTQAPAAVQQPSGHEVRLHTHVSFEQS